MRPMGFWESILATVFCLVFYATVGWAVVTGAEVEKRTDNSVKLLGIGIAWPVVLLIGLGRWIKRMLTCLIKDALRERNPIRARELENC